MSNFTLRTLTKAKPMISSITVSGAGLSVGMRIADAQGTHWKIVRQNELGSFDARRIERLERVYLRAKGWLQSIWS
jgi:hypothetical protein